MRSKHDTRLHMSVDAIRGHTLQVSCQDLYTNAEGLRIRIRIPATGGACLYTLSCGVIVRNISSWCCSLRRQVFECMRRLLLTGVLVFVPDTSGQVAYGCIFAFIRYGGSTKIMFERDQRESDLLCIDYMLQCYFGTKR